MCFALLIACGEKKETQTIIRDGLEQSKEIDKIKQEIDRGNLIIGEVSSIGSGCDNQANVVIDETKMIIDQSLSAHADKRINRSFCGLSMPIEILNNKKLIISSIQIEGEHQTWNLNKSEIKLELFESGLLGENIALSSKNLSPVFTQTVSLGENKIETLCGAQTLLRLNASLLMMDNNPRGEALNISTISFPDIKIIDC